MEAISTLEEIESYEHQRALVGVYVDHGYSRERISWILEAREGFDAHVGQHFHLLIPHKSGGYSMNQTNESHYGVKLAREIINELDIKHAELPCIVFRATYDDKYFLKLGRMNKEETTDILGRLCDLVVEKATKGPNEPHEFRAWINMQAGNFLRRQKMLSVVGRSVPALSSFLGAAVDVSELV